MPSSQKESASARRSFSLGGAAVPLDPRVNAVRSDLADLRLAQFVFAPHYAAPMVCVASRHSDILPAADPGVAPLSEILPGDTFELFEISRSFGWGMCSADGSVGFVDRAALDVAGPPLKAAREALARDFVAAAEALAGVPYRAGGRSMLGVDPGGMVFFALRSIGIQAMRFVDLQATTWGVDAGDAPLARGTIVFFARHAAIMVDDVSAMFVAEDLPVTRLALADILARDDIGAEIARRRAA